MKFSILKIYLAADGYLSDEIGIERRFVEGYDCPTCGNGLSYRGYEKAGETRCYGVCEKCDFARKFYFNSPVLADGLRRFSKAEG